MCQYDAVFLVAVEKNSRGNNLGRKVEMNRSWVIALLGIGQRSVPGTYTMFEWRASQTVQNPLGLSPVHILI